MAGLDELVPEPRLYPAEPDARARVEEIDRWAEQELRALARRLTWWVIRRHPAAMLSYAEDSRLPFPGFVTRALAPGIARIEWSINDVSDEAARRDLQALPDHLKKIDAWIGEGVLGAQPPNAADLQIGSS